MRVHFSAHGSPTWLLDYYTQRNYRQLRPTARRQSFFELCRPPLVIWYIW